MNNQTHQQKTNKKILCFVLILVGVATWCSSFAQVSISNVTVVPDNTAMLQVEAGTDPAKPRGFLLPRFTSAQETALLSTSPAEALMYYSLSKKKFIHFDGTSAIMINPWNVNSDLSRLTYNPAPGFRVGIGTNAPASALDVSGTITSTGLNVNGTITSSGLNVSGAVTSTGLTVTGNISVNTGTVSGFGTIPLGGIIMWSGTVIPAGWALCNGQTTSGYKTPDLRGRFIAGYNALDADYDDPGELSRQLTGVNDVGEVGPPTSTDYDLVDGGKKITLKIASMPSHSHGNNTGTNGNHNHTIPGQDNDGWAFGIARRADNSSPPSGTGTIPTNFAGNHSHSISLDGGGASHENRPPYYVLAFIMRVQ